MKVMSNWDRNSGQYNYGYSQPYQRPVSNLFDMRSSLKGKNSLSYGNEIGKQNEGQHSQSYSHYSGNHSSNSRETAGYFEPQRTVSDSSVLYSRRYDTNSDSDTRYSQSYNKKPDDRFDLKSNTNTAYSLPVWNEISNKNLGQYFGRSYESEAQNPCKRTISDLFDIPFEEKCHQTNQKPEKIYNDPRKGSQNRQVYSSPAWNEVSSKDLTKDSSRSLEREAQNSQKRTISDLFDFPYDEKCQQMCQFKSQNRGSFNISDGNQTDYFRRQDDFQRKGNREETEFPGKNTQFQKPDMFLRKNPASINKCRQSELTHFEDSSVSKALNNTVLSTQLPINSENTEMKKEETYQQFGQARYGQLHSDEEDDKEVDEGDGCESDKEEDYDKGNQFIPDESLIKKHLLFPPSAEEMGNIFKGIVLYYNFKSVKNCPEKNPFVVICDSFRRSDRFANLEVEDGCSPGKPSMKFCTLRCYGMMMVRGVGENNNLKEPRVRAAVELINKLAMTCYTLKVKTKYCGNRDFEVPGVYRVVSTEDAPDKHSACKFIDNYFREDSDCELIFPTTFMSPIRSHIKKFTNQYESRLIGNTWVSVFKKRTPQYWRDKILASGEMENEKFVLIPPQGLGNDLIKNFNIKDFVPVLKKYPIIESDWPILYGPRKIGPSICKVVVPWERRGGGRRTKSNNKKMKKIKKQVQSGVPLDQVKGFRFLNSKKKKKLRAQFQFGT